VCASPLWVGWRVCLSVCVCLCVRERAGPLAVSPRRAARADRCVREALWRETHPHSSPRAQEGTPRALRLSRPARPCVCLVPGPCPAHTHARVRSKKSGRISLHETTPCGRAAMDDARLTQARTIGTGTPPRASGAAAPGGAARRPAEVTAVLEELMLSHPDATAPVQERERIAALTGLSLDQVRGRRRHAARPLCTCMRAHVSVCLSASKH
jgi:hypothetical protein